MGKAISSLGVALLVKGYVKATTDLTRDESKLYYELDSTTGVYIVAKDSTAVGSLYEIVGASDGGTNAWVQPVCLTDVPDLGGDTDKIETTTLCDKQRTYIEGIFDAGESLDFSANYVHNAFVAIREKMGGQKLPIMVVFGGITVDSSTPPVLGGGQGSCSFDGYINAKIGGFGVSEVIPMTLSITIASELTFA